MLEVVAAVVIVLLSLPFTGAEPQNPLQLDFQRELLADVDYRTTYITRHTFAAWALAVGMNPDRLVALMGHNSKQMIYEVYGKYVKGLEKDAGRILEYLGRDFLELQIQRPHAFTQRFGESLGESLRSSCVRH